MLKLEKWKNDVCDVLNGLLYAVNSEYRIFSINNLKRDDFIFIDQDYFDTIFIDDNDTIAFSIKQNQKFISLLIIDVYWYLNNNDDIYCELVFRPIQNDKHDNWEYVETLLLMFGIYFSVNIDTTKIKTILIYENFITHNTCSDIRIQKHKISDYNFDIISHNIEIKIQQKLLF